MNREAPFLRTGSRHDKGTYVIVDTMKTPALGPGVFTHPG